MKQMSTFRYYWLTFFGKPVCDREIYKTIRKQKVQSILEIGLGDGLRAETMIQVAQKFGSDQGVRYTGIDLFEGRQGSQRLLLREMHKRVNSTGAKCQLVPGEPSDAIARIANSHLRTDLVIISGNYTSADLEPCWFYFPRMLHANSIVLVQSDLDTKFQSLCRLEIENLAKKRTSSSQSAAA